jgi:hypothetical protein
MAWTARLETITPDVNAKTLTLSITINGGLTPYTLQLVKGFGDLTLSDGGVRDEVRAFIENIKKMEALYQTLKPLEGQNIPLGV